MRRHLKLLLPIVILALVAAACSDDEPEASGDLEGRTIKVAVENAYPPYNFIASDGSEGLGWDYDTWREICERAGCTAEFVEAAWDGLFIEIAQGTYDVAADGISITDERDETVDFSDPYMVIEQKLMVRLDEDRFGNVDEFLAGDWRVGTQVATTNYETMLGLLGGDDSRIDAYDPFGVAVQALIVGDVDAVIIDDTAGQGFKGENEDKVKLLPDAIQSDPLGFAYPPDSDLIGPVNAILQAMIDDGTMDQLVTTWFVDYDPSA
jgi:polar amino acid transport system substrate-binding protein